ncbi:hypothetical protein B296_00030483 [Ensete ventricosum]|uniref:Uncharacterized protein n=1 Tax=Ensete ventricosum TaxID=4639 RepID=A0A427AIP3_ENSVE|nr:hypothetical protein B296_00030483 [Ensete ventricosum]
MDLNVLRKKPRMPSRKSAPAARPGSTQPEVEVIHMETSAKRPVGMRKHKSRHGEGSSRRATRGKESEVFAEDSSPTYRRPKSMKDLCGMRVHEDDEGYYVLQMADWAPRDSSAAMQVRWPNLSYQAKVWDDSEAASEFGRGVLHPTLAKNLYTLPSEFLIDRAAKQIALMALLDRVHDSGRLVTHMGNRASLLEAEIEKLKMEGDPEQLTIARQGMKEQRADRQKANDELLKLMRENEFLKAELPSKSVANYKRSIGFGWGLQRMGEVSYKYGYRARCQARYPDLEVDNDPFTEQPEDSLVPMETRQEFNDSIPPEEYREFCYFWYFGRSARVFCM